MSTSRECPNPLRPYYIPPSIGFPPDTPSPHTSSSTPNLRSNGTSYASSARDIFADIDYSDYVSDDSKGAMGMIQQMLDEAMHKYIAVLFAQPFDVAKTILQVKRNGPAVVAQETGREHGRRRSREEQYGDYPSSDSDPDEPAYFTSSTPLSNRHSSSSPSRRRHPTDRAGYVLPSPSSPSLLPHQLPLKRTDSLLEVLGALWSKEGVWGVWKGTNATFIYSALLRTIENWTRSFLSAVLNAPDPGLAGGIAVEVVDSPYPWTSLGIAVAAAAVAGVVLVPLDIIRTRLMVTTTLHPRPGLFKSLQQLPSLLCPSTLLFPTLLHSTVSPLILHSTPLLLRSNFNIDAVTSPSTFSFFTFTSHALELFIKLPLETVLRRGQLAVLRSEPYRTGKEGESVVDVGGYDGVVGTMWMIVREEGDRNEGGDRDQLDGVERRQRKLMLKRGQGVKGLWRGWRVGMWGLVGMYGAAAMGGIGGGGGEF